MQEKKTATAARAALAPSEYKTVHIPFCGLDEFDSILESEATYVTDECLTQAARIRLDSESGLYIDGWTNEVRDTIARSWSREYFAKIEEITGVEVPCDTESAVYENDGNWGFQWVEVPVDPEALQVLFDENKKAVREALARALTPRSGFAPFDSAIEEAERFDVTEMRPALIEAALTGILDAYQSDDTDGLIDECLPYEIEDEAREAFGIALETSARDVLGPYALWSDVEAAAEAGEIAVEKIPECWLSYLVNCDPSGLPEEELTECDTWAEGVKDRGFDASRLDPLDIDRDVDGTVRVMVPRWN